MHIGKRLKEIRQSKGMTLAELAEKSGVQIATLSRIENDKMTGTLQSHLNIAEALGVDVTHLYKDIIREDSPADLKIPEQTTDVYQHKDLSSSEILVSQLFGKKMTPVLIKLGPRGQTPQEQNKSGTEKFVFVLEGKIEVTVGIQPYVLEKNSSLYFDASLPHHLKNLVKSPSRALLVATPMVL